MTRALTHALPPSPTPPSRPPSLQHTPPARGQERPGPGRGRTVDGCAIKVLSHGGLGAEEAQEVLAVRCRGAVSGCGTQGAPSEGGNKVHSRKASLVRTRWFSGNQISHPWGFGILYSIKLQNALVHVQRSARPAAICYQSFFREWGLSFKADGAKPLRQESAFEVCL